VQAIVASGADFSIRRFRPQHPVIFQTPPPPLSVIPRPSGESRDARRKGRSILGSGSGFRRQIYLLIYSGKLSKEPQSTFKTYNAHRSFQKPRLRIKTGIILLYARRINRPQTLWPLRQKRFSHEFFREIVPLGSGNSTDLIV